MMERFKKVTMKDEDTPPTAMQCHGNYRSRLNYGKETTRGTSPQKLKLAIRNEEGLGFPLISSRRLFYERYLLHSRYQRHGSNKNTAEDLNTRSLCQPLEPFLFIHPQ